MERALAGGLVQDLHRLLQRGCSGLLVAPLNRLNRILGGSANARLDRTIALLALQALTMALLGRRMNWNMRHKQSYLTVGASAINMLALGGMS